MRVLRRGTGTTYRNPSNSMEAVIEPLIGDEKYGESHHDAQLRSDALEWLKRTTRQRAGKEGKRLFVVVYAKGQGRMAVRREPSRKSEIAGARSTGDEVIVEEVTEEGWVRLSDLDAYAGFQSFHAGQEKWMLTYGSDVGELLREVILDENGNDVDDDSWLPDM